LDSLRTGEMTRWALRVFNLAMALLLVASLAVMFL
jgi:hypothetical protein